jgi:hypothetical protein
MSNITNTVPMVIDTPAPICGNDITIRAITFEINSGETVYNLIIKDKNGKVVYKATNNTKGSNSQSFPLISNGLEVTSMGNISEVYIYT